MWLNKIKKLFPNSSLIKARETTHTSQSSNPKEIYRSRNSKTKYLKGSNHQKDMSNTFERKSTIKNESTTQKSGISKTIPEIDSGTSNDPVNFQRNQPKYQINLQTMGFQPEKLESPVQVTKKNFGFQEDRKETEESFEESMSPAQRKRREREKRREEREERRKQKREERKNKYMRKRRNNRDNEKGKEDNREDKGNDREERRKKRNRRDKSETRNQRESVELSKYSRHSKYSRNSKYSKYSRDRKEKNFQENKRGGRNDARDETKYDRHKRNRRADNKKTSKVIQINDTTTSFQQIMQNVNDQSISISNFLNSKKHDFL